MDDRPSTVKGFLQAAEQYVSQKYKYLAMQKHLYCTVHTVLKGERAITCLKLINGKVTNVQPPILIKKCHSYEVIVELLKRFLKDLCNLADKYTALFIFTMETVTFMGLHSYYIDSIIKHLYPNHITDQWNNFRICNIGRHWIRVANNGRESSIWDSQVFQQVFLTSKRFKFKDCPQQIDNVSCGLYALCFEIFVKYKLDITPQCLKIEDPCQVVHDLCRTFFSGKMTEVDFISKYYRFHMPSYVMLNGQFLTAPNQLVSISEEMPMFNQTALPEVNSPPEVLAPTNLIEGTDRVSLDIPTKNSDKTHLVDEKIIC